LDMNLLKSPEFRYKAPLRWLTSSHCIGKFIKLTNKMARYAKAKTRKATRHLVIAALNVSKCSELDGFIMFSAI